MDNAVNWFGIPAADMERAKTFYEAIFDIEMHRMDMGDGFEMVLFPTNQNGVGGAIIRNEEWYKPSETHGSLLYLNANPNLQVVLDRVEEAGGKISIPKRLIAEEHGYMVAIIDSEGNRMALHSMG